MLEDKLRPMEEKLAWKLDSAKKNQTHGGNELSSK